MIELMNYNVHLLDELKWNNDIPVVLYGTGFAGTFFLYYYGHELNHIDFIVRTDDSDDRTELAGIDIINEKDLEKLNTKIYLILCLDAHISSMDTTVSSLYSRLCTLHIDAKVFNFFGNAAFFSTNHVTVRNATIQLFNHPFNCGYPTNRMTERSLELALLRHWMDRKNSNSTFYEIGAVSPYYFIDPRIKKVIDPTDKHACVTDHVSLFDLDLTSDQGVTNVFSISTVEHIGTGDYGLQDSENCIDGIYKIINESESCFITFPINYNKVLDEWVKAEVNNPMITVYQRKLGNEWVATSSRDFATIPYSFLWANGVCVIEK